ncbi:MAG: phosphate ABC transporter permease PstA [Oscillospiraceae bacterium]|jgi:phosphate transport system permease protein|nr:phosphate ABC transporter permease PstA [Oscillospiraceae bacterium]
MNNKSAAQPLNSRIAAGRRLNELVLRALVYLAALIVTLLLIGLIGYIFYRGLPNLTWELLSTQRSVLAGRIGILPNLLFTLYTILTALVIALPVGIGSAIFLNEYARSGKLVRFIEFSTETLTGIPSIIYGLVGMLFFSQRLGLRSSVLAGSLTLVIMILPSITRTTQESLKTTPQAYRDGAAALGAPKWYAIRTIVLPCTVDGIVSGAILAVGRIVGESAALLFTAGAGYVLVTNYIKALSVSGGTLSVMLYVYTMEHGEFGVGFAIAAILMLLALVINFAAKAARKKLKRVG